MRCLEIAGQDCLHRLQQLNSRIVCQYLHQLLQKAPSFPTCFFPLVGEFPEQSALFFSLHNQTVILQVLWYSQEPLFSGWSQTYFAVSGLHWQEFPPKKVGSFQESGRPSKTLSQLQSGNIRNPYMVRAQIVILRGQVWTLRYRILNCKFMTFTLLATYLQFLDCGVSRRIV